VVELGASAIESFAEFHDGALQRPIIEEHKSSVSSLGHRLEKLLRQKDSLTVEGH
jgi:hypothetical protein